MEINIHLFEIENSIGRTIRGDIRLPAIGGTRPAVIYIHGFKGFRRWGFIPYFCERAAGNGAISINFDFSLNGICDDRRPWFDEDDFRRNTISQQLEDALLVIDSLLRGNLIPNNDNSEFNGDIYLAGHSMGGAMSVMCASRRKINKIALWASISTFGRYTPRQKKIWRKRGELNATVQKTGQKLPIGTDYLDDIEQNAEEFDPVASIRGIDSQILIIHPKQDVTVNKDEALRLAGSAGTEPVFIEKAGHTFGAGHPMGEPPEAVERATELTLRFFGLL